jgi:hypothetical protein
LTVIVAGLTGFGVAAVAPAAAVTFDVRSVGAFPFGEPSDVEYADFDDDGRLDVVVAAGQAGVYAFAGRPDGGLAPTFSAPSSFSTSVTSAAAPADVTGDGFLDIVYARQGEVVVRAGDGAGGFGAAVVTSLAQAIAVDTGDFDGDDRADGGCPVARRT